MADRCVLGMHFYGVHIQIYLLVGQALLMVVLQQVRHRCHCQ